MTLSSSSSPMGLATSSSSIKLPGIALLMLLDEVPPFVLALDVSNLGNDFVELDRLASAGNDVDAGFVGVRFSEIFPPRGASRLALADGAEWPDICLDEAPEMVVVVYLPV